MDCPHYPGSKDEKGNTTVGIIKGVKDYYEISNVSVPCQPAAGIRRDNQKSLEVPSEEAVDKILNDKSLGDNPLEDEVKPEEVVEAPAPEAVVADAPEAVEPAEAPEAVVEDVKALVKEAVAEATSELKSLVAELKAALETKKAVEQSAEEESTEEIARKLLNQQVENEPTSSVPVVDFSKSGWAAGLLSQFKSSNQ
jgi:hypothetical protein